LQRLTCAKELRARLTLLGDDLKRLEPVKTHARLDAPVLGNRRRGRWCFFRPGTACLDRYTCSSNLASRGFVVAAIDHPYSVAIVVFPDGRVALRQRRTAREHRSSAGLRSEPPTCSLH
jgi:hypothetical protein